MIRKAKSPSERLQEYFEADEEDPFRKEVVRDPPKRIKKKNDKRGVAPDWFEFDTCARFALQSPDDRDPVEAPIAAAFEAANLDSKNPLHWRQLITYFAWAHFGPKRGRGRPATWNSERYGQRLEDVDRIKSKNERLSDSAACQNLKKGEFKEKYEGQSAERLRKALREARNPYFNAELAKLVDEDWWAQIHKYHDEHDEYMSGEQDDELIAQLSKHYSEIIAGRWRKS